jgi:hypothetical protein
MRPDPLVPGRRDLEHELAGRTCPEPAADLRDRILAAVAAQRPRARRRLWSYAAHAAAALVLVLNLALSVSNGFRYEAISARVVPTASGWPPQGPPANAADRFQMFAATVLARLPAAPDAGPVSQRFFEQQEN